MSCRNLQKGHRGLFLSTLYRPSLRISFHFRPLQNPSQRPLDLYLSLPWARLKVAYSLPSLLSLFCSVPCVFLSSTNNTLARSFTSWPKYAVLRATISAIKVPLAMSPADRMPPATRVHWRQFASRQVRLKIGSTQCPTRSNRKCGLFQGELPLACRR